MWFTCALPSILLVLHLNVCPMLACLRMHALKVDNGPVLLAKGISPGD